MVGYLRVLVIVLVIQDGLEVDGKGTRKGDKKMADFERIQKKMEGLKKKSIGMRQPGDRPKRCPRNTFTCGTKECISLSHRCDGERDCADGSDERNCGKFKMAGDDYVCPHNLYTCANKECTIATARCDGIKHCSDGSDEKRCRKIQKRERTNAKGEKLKCAKFLHECPSGECILPVDICDGKKDCADGSDEAKCQSFPEDEPQVFRKNEGNANENKNKNEEEIVDEDEKEEEVIAEEGCGDQLFECDNKECIWPKSVCDGQRDCSDGSDEKHCEENKEEEQEKRLESKEEKEVVEKEERRSDENVGKTDDNSQRNKKEKAKSGKECRKGQFRCQNGECADVQKRCNSIKDCKDGSDEWDCGVYYTRIPEGGKNSKDGKAEL